MSVDTIANVKAKFESGDYPTGPDFEDLIDTTNDLDESTGSIPASRVDTDATGTTVQENLDTLNTHESNTSDPHNVTKAQVDLGNVTDDAQVKITDKGIALGVVPLNGSVRIDETYLDGVVPLFDSVTGKIKTTDLPDTVIGGLNFQGVWDASPTGTQPDDSLGTGELLTKGMYWVVSTAGNATLLGAIDNDWQTGDFAIYRGINLWDKVDNTDIYETSIQNSSVTSVATGGQDGVNTDFVVSLAMRLGSSQVYLNGSRLHLGNDYTEIDSVTLRFIGTAIPIVSDTIIVDYVQQ